MRVLSGSLTCTAWHQHTYNRTTVLAVALLPCMFCRRQARRPARRRSGAQLGVATAVLGAPCNSVIESLPEP